MEAALPNCTVIINIWKLTLRIAFNYLVYSCTTCLTNEHKGIESVFKILPDSEN